jgi:hypothetical protein
MSLGLEKRETMNKLNEMYLHYIGIDPELFGHIVLGAAILTVFLLVI